MKQTKQRGMKCQEFWFLLKRWEDWSTHELPIRVLKNYFLLRQQWQQLVHHNNREKSKNSNNNMKHTDDIPHRVWQKYFSGLARCEEVRLWLHCWPVLMRFAGIGVESAGRSKDNEGPVVSFTSNETLNERSVLAVRRGGEKLQMTRVTTNRVRWHFCGAAHFENCASSYLTQSACFSSLPSQQILILQQRIQTNPPECLEFKSTPFIILTQILLTK